MTAKGASHSAEAASLKGWTTQDLESRTRAGGTSDLSVTCKPSFHKNGGNDSQELGTRTSGRKDRKKQE